MGLGPILRIFHLGLAASTFPISVLIVILSEHKFGKNYRLCIPSTRAFETEINARFVIAGCSIEWAGFCFFFGNLHADRSQ